MISQEMQFESERERLFVEQAQAMFREMTSAARRAPFGEVLNAIETAALSTGRELTRRGLEAAAQDAAESVEKKGRPRERVAAADRSIIAARSRGKSSRRPAR